jgi:lipopolysaccharide assembly outer membrane protein LptD (OstA)
MIIYTFLDGTKLNGLYNLRFSDRQIEIELNSEEYAYLAKNILAAHYVDGKVVYKNLDAINQKQALEKEQADILQWLADNDWKVNKVVVGEWEKQDPRWLQYINERTTKRNRLEQIEGLL